MAMAFNTAKIEEDIRSIDVKAAASGTMTELNSRMRRSLDLQRQFRGEDQWITFAPKSAVLDPHRPARPKTVRVTAYQAAEKFAWADRKGDHVSMATPEEISAAIADNEMRREAIQKSLSVSAQQLSAATLKAIFPGVQVPPSVNLADEMASHVTAAPAQSQPVSVGTQGTEGIEVPSPPASLGEIGTAKQRQALAAAGFTTLEAVAASSPEALSKVKGIGQSKAASLIVSAGEALASDEDDEAQE